MSVQGGKTPVFKLPYPTGEDLVRDGAEAIEALAEAIEALAADGIIANPTGTILEYASREIPPGYLMCDGSTIAKADYPKLADILGDTYGEADPLHVVLPNRMGRVAVGIDPESELFAELGATGGELSHVLTDDEMAEHAHDMTHWHSGTTDNAEVPAHFGNAQQINTAVIGYGASPPGAEHRINNSGHGHPFTTSASSTATTGRAGASAAHNNVQPFITAVFIIKT